MEILKFIEDVILVLPRMALEVMKQLFGLKATIIIVVATLIVTIVKFFKKPAR